VWFGIWHSLIDTRGTTSECQIHHTSRRIKSFDNAAFGE
jgi:hypothetical protein